MELELALAILALATKVAPIIEAKIKSGEIKPEEQQATREAYLAYRDAMDAALDGPEWQLSTEATSSADPTAPHIAQQ